MVRKTKQNNSLLLILGDQLFPLEFIKETGAKKVFIAEDYGLCTTTKHHKQKICLFFSAMRAYAEMLKNNGFEVVYYELSPGTFLEKFEKTLNDLDTDAIHYFEIDDKPFRYEFLKKFKHIPPTEHPSPKFVVSHEEFKKYLTGTKKPFMKSFYEQVRRTLDLLMEEGKPIGGKFSFDSENRKKLPKDVKIPSRNQKASDQLIDSVKTVVEENFPKHPGDLSYYRWDYTREAYLQKLDHFLSKLLPNFGPYQDAMTDRYPFLFHSLLSPGLNMGLITPADIMSRVPKLLKKQNHLASIEGFIRQVFGWREFVRGIYENFSDKMEQENYWNHNRTLKACWWDATTGLAPIDSVINKSLKYGYAHHIERLMLIANIFHLIEAKPTEVYRWFMDMYIDSADWVMQANVYGMGLMSEGGIFATKPYICGSNYVLKMSDYKKGPWCEVLDGLYWRFVNKNRDFFASNPRMAMMVRMFDKMSEDKKKRILGAAEEFINKSTEEQS